MPFGQLVAVDLYGLEVESIHVAVWRYIATGENGNVSCQIGR